MILAEYRKTMANAKPVMARKRPTPKRDRLIAMSRRWQESREGQWQALVEADHRYWRLLTEDNPVPILDHTPATEMIARVAWWHGLTRADLVGLIRDNKIAEARHDAIAAVTVNCRYMGRPLKPDSVGRLFDRDRTTILHSLSRRGLR